MSAGWQVGDLAVCVETSPGTFGDPHPCKKGAIYKVERVVVARTGTLGLGLEGITFPNSLMNADDAACYRKIKPDTEPCEEEFTVLIKRGRKVQA